MEITKKLTASDYFYCESSGHKLYHIKGNGSPHKRVAKKNIDSLILKDIKSQDEIYFKPFREYLDELNERINELLREKKFVKNSVLKGNLLQIDVLRDLKINNRKEWKDWLRKNHPDKGGDTELCAAVIVEGRKIGY